MKTYQHYKTKNLYQLIEIAIHTETLEEMVIYKALYDSEKYGYGSVWARPKKMFFENVTHHGQVTPRFKLIETADK